MKVSLKTIQKIMNEVCERRDIDENTLEYYTDEIILKYDNYDDFLYSNMENVSKFVGFEFDYEGEKYIADIVIEWFKECQDVRIMDENYNEILDLYDVYLDADNKDELIEKMKELLAENLW